MKNNITSCDPNHLTNLRDPRYPPKLSLFIQQYEEIGQLIAPSTPRAMSEWKMARARKNGKNSVA